MYKVKIAGKVTEDFSDYQKKFKKKNYRIYQHE